MQLLPAIKDTDWVGVNLYVDDKGVAKQSPINQRASAICAACGIPTEVRGDAFVAKLRDDQNDIFERQDFRIADIASDAAWVKTAAARNAARNPEAQMAAAKQLTSSGGVAAEPVAPLAERLAEATTAKAEGAELFKQQDLAGEPSPAGPAWHSPHPRTGPPAHLALSSGRRG